MVGFLGKPCATDTQSSRDPAEAEDLVYSIRLFVVLELSDALCFMLLVLVGRSLNS